MQLNDLSKDALIEVMRRVNDGKVGDTGRTSKADYIKLLSEGFDRDQVLEAVQAIAENNGAKPVNLFAKPIPAADPTTAAAQLAQALQAFIPQNNNAPIDAEAVREIIRAELANVAPREIVINQQGREAVQLEGITHPLFEKVLRLTAAGVNVLLTGAAGAGKTKLAEQVALALGVKFGAINCTAGASESQLLGWLLPTGANGTFEYNPAPFIKMYEAGNSLFLFDEMDAADPNFLLVANTALANGHTHVPMRLNNPEVKRGDNMHIMATANTFGTGADMIYAGRNQLDGATLDRFYIVHIDYNSLLEAQIMGINAPAQKAWQPVQNDTAEKAAADVAELHQWLINVREKVTANRMRRVISTRAFQKAQAARFAGLPAKEIKKDLLAGWTKDELAKVGE
jgi:cobaltochelatase CobS